MSPLGLIVPDTLRASLRTALLGGGLPPSAVDEIADLATLAVNDAVAAIDRAGARASSSTAQMAIVSAALSSALGIIETNLKGLVAFGELTGMRVVESTVTVDSAER